ncbi:hypothetical protein LDENG_00163380 [Lucifuga dentata]|nr:hypothetical protein LDENG_00163380 [Lucifuga dentata]
MLRKKDGTYRLCIDYRALNECTIEDAYPLPCIQDTLDTLSTTKWFSTLDLASGYWQVELTPRACKAAAFCTRNGLFEWNFMPFGLYNALATFQRLMDRVSAGMQWETCLVYLDDIIVLGKDVLEMLGQLGQVFNRLHQANMKLKSAKCCLFRHQVAYLGHIVSEDGVTTDPSKVQKVQDWLTPTTLQEWTEECQVVFNKLKHLLTTAPVLGYPLDQGNMILDTDASDVGIDTVLSQVQQGRERVLAYGSCKLSKTEQNYCTTWSQRDSLPGGSRVLASTTLRSSITPAGCTAMQTAYPGDPAASPVHWEWRDTHEALPADTDNLKPPERIYLTKTNKTEVFCGWSPEELRQAQEADPDIAPIRMWMEANGERPPWVTVSPCSPATKMYWSQWKQLYIRDGILVRRFYCLDATQFYPQVVLPCVFRPDVMRQMHEGQVGGHFGVERTVARLQTRYFWYWMREDVALWCGTCTSCASKARPLKTPQAPMGTVRVGAPMERVALDFMGPLNETERNNRYVLLIQDYFTKWVEAFPLPNVQAITVAEVLASEWVCHYGAPQTLHSDQGRNFKCEVFQKMCTLFGIEKTHTTSFRPQSDGQVEWFIATLQRILATTAERCHWDWDLMIPYAVMAYRATKHSATGFTPHFMMFGREVSEPVDLIAGLPPDPDTTSSAPEYVQHIREHLDGGVTPRFGCQSWGPRPGSVQAVLQ